MEFVMDRWNRRVWADLTRFEEAPPGRLFVAWMAGARSGRTWPAQAEPPSASRRPLRPGRAVRPSAGVTLAANVPAGRGLLGNGGVAVDRRPAWQLPAERGINPCLR